MKLRNDQMDRARDANPRMMSGFALAALMGTALALGSCGKKDASPAQGTATASAPPASAQKSVADTAAAPAPLRSSAPTPSPSSSVSASPSASAAAAPTAVPSATPSAAPATTTAPTPAASSSASAAPVKSGPQADACKAFPSIERWATKRNLDPIFVRAVALTQSNFDDCAAAKACKQGYDDSGCFEPGPAQDAGYAIAYDEMYDPAGRCQMANAAPGQNPDWRFLSSGLMQTLEPPYTFWPPAYHPEGAEGQYFDVFDRSGLKQLDFGDARACNPNFNPFSAEDSICLGTAKLERMMRSANAWVASHKGMLVLGAKGKNRTVFSGREYTEADGEKMLTLYVAGNMYSGLLHMKAGAGHPRCPSSQRSGDCWAQDFQESAAVTDAYCASQGGRADSRCDKGHPRRSAPTGCFGYTDFVQFVRECEIPFTAIKRDYGAMAIDAYNTLKARCRR